MVSCVIANGCFTDTIISCRTYALPLSFSPLLIALWSFGVPMNLKLVYLGDGEKSNGLQSANWRGYFRVCQ